MTSICFALATLGIGEMIYVTLLNLWQVHWLTHSCCGNSLRALREDDACADAMGIDVGRLKLQSFGISCCMAGMAIALVRRQIRRDPGAGAARMVSPGQPGTPLPALRRSTRHFGGLTAMDDVSVGAIRDCGLRDALGARNGVRGEAISRVRTEMLAKVGLAPFADELAAKLSSGKRKMLEIARAPASRPRLLILDEPAAVRQDPAVLDACLGTGDA